MQRKFWQVGAIACGLALLLGAGRRVVTRPCVPPTVPTYDYQWKAESRHVTALSTDVVREISPLERRPFTLGVPAVGTPLQNPPVTRGRVRTFLLSAGPLVVDHCSVSRVTLVLHEPGYWTLSLRADQNPWFEGTPRNEITRLGTGPSPNGLVSNGLKRNEFFVRVRCLATAVGAADVAQPVVAELAPCPFWVQRGQPADKMWADQFAPQIAQQFDLIERIEVEFYYR